MLNEVVFKRGRGMRTVRVTPNHRWLTKSGWTTNLSLGDALVQAPDLTIGEVDKLSWCLGFGFGDGTQAGKYFRLRLCGNKVKHAQMFLDAGFEVRYPKCYNGDASVSLLGYSKGLPSGDIDVRSFALGYAAADASRKNIQATGEEAINFIRESFDTAGLYIGAEQDFSNTPTNFGERKDKTVMFNITKPHHYRWVVDSIKRSCVEDVWCLEVEEDHTFILQGGIVTGNCMLIDLKGMLENGFNMGNAEIETPKSISTACAITAQIIAQVASHIYGGNTINRIDEILAPYVRKSYDKHHRQGRLWLKDEAKASVYATKMTEKETYDAFQALEYEINTLHTANGQTPFCTFGFGLGTDWEERIIQESILKVRLAGLGKAKRTAIFPKLVFAIKKGVNFDKDDVNYDIKQMALECAAKRMYPDILNYDKLVEVTGGFKNPMGCRSFLSEWDDTHDGRNNLGVVSLNLVRLGIRSGGDIDRFNALLNEGLELCKKALDTRIQALIGVKASV
ncbi:MAG: anaerobic ribonucleoside-triphosphate reductase, partial [Aeromonas sp.]